MGADTWGRVKRLFDAALPLPPSERPRFLEFSCAEPAVRDEVISLLSVHDSDPEFLDNSRPLVDPAAFGAQAQGQKLGAWRLLREVGRGGMGVVWEAERADGSYEQRVAVKFVQCPALGHVEAGRLAEERRILAGLHHPHIARLLDGGATEAGSPYLVMEFVDGEPVDAWCERHAASVRERLEVFLRVCAGVEYAHRHLVVHRDLKPANILVTPDGSPKLLDFGIAKLLDAGGAAANTVSNTTATAARLLTPDYASPEQIRGEPVSTSADVYSLGVVLYVLLSGQKPYSAHGTAPLDLMRAICESDPAPPSAAATDSKPLRGDLDAIVLQALRKSPEERYASVRALADDIRAWLRGDPVSAHPPDVAQRFVKLVRRNRGASIAAAVALLSLAGGAAGTAWQAHLARQAQVRAESRFRQVRQFSRSLLFEVHESIRDLPGATAARTQLLSKATGFLDGLANDAGDDAALKVELAEGYRRLGHVQGSALSDNLGRRDQALESFRKATRLAEEALATSPDNTEAALVLTGAYDDLTDAAFMSGNLEEAERWFVQHRDLILRLDGQKLSTKARVSVATSFASLGYHRARRDELPAAKALYKSAVDRFAALVREGDGSKELRSQYPFALKRLGAILISENDLAGAEKRYREALAIEDAVIGKNPSNSRMRVDRTLTQSDVALILKKRGDTAGATRLYEQVLATRSEALGADAGNLRLMSLVASTQGNLSALYSTAGRHADGIRVAREAVVLRDRAAARAKSPREDAYAAGARVALAECLLQAGLAGQARSVMQQARPSIERLRRAGAVTNFDKAMLADYDRLAALSR